MFITGRSISFNAGDCAGPDDDAAEQSNLRQWRRAFELTLLCVCFSALLLAALCRFDGRNAAQLKLLDKINPNTAPAASLVRLPGVGPARAQAIIDYREKFGKDGHAFNCPQDLDKISGIGPKTVGKMRQWLCFEPACPKEEMK